MKHLVILILGLLLFGLPETGNGQSLGDLARKERARKAKQSQTGTVVTNDSVKRPGEALKPVFDATRKDDLDYLLSQLEDPNPAPQVYLALVPLKDQAEERLVALLGDPAGRKRISPAAALIIMGDTRGLGAMAELLPTTEELGRKVQFNAGGQSESGEEFQNALQRTFESTQAMNLANFGIWRFVNGAGLTPEALVKRLAGSAIDLTKSPDRGQRVYTAALRHSDSNVRRAAITLVAAMAEGNDFGYDPDSMGSRNEGPIQDIVSFIATRR
ncbi:MAG: hypothetical protein O7F56_06845 [Acidobacteria bacterium]|nr:hypothetical protein [Acidobacteriota bacterium]